jgi:hypothetical protein
MKLVVYFLIIMILFGCNTYPKNITVSTTQPFSTETPNIICWSSKDIDSNSQKLWLLEARRRFNNPILFACHGGYEFVEKQIGDTKVVELEWWVYPDAPRQPMSAQSAADFLANLYPDRDIVFTACNENGYELNTKRVFYAKSKVWIIPDDMQSGPVFHETKRNEGDVGSIWEFVSYDGHQYTTQHIVATTQASSNHSP